ncbi:MAG: glycosyltransferase family 2 protein [Lachnospiraceae bacterium]|nr:glycosyltransferase family 2 protein [Lachnospiraceae bacterium]
MDKILLFIPAYNCEKQIVRVLGQLDSGIMRYITEVIVVNNRSTDQTEAVVSAFMDRHPDFPLKLLLNHENYGLGGSHKVAFSYAMEHGFDYVIVLHGDDQGSIADFLPVLRSGYYRKHACILGARFMRGSRLIGYSLFRTFGNIVYDFLFAAVIRRRVYDLGSGLNMYRVSDLESRYYERFPDNLMFNYCMVLALDYYNLDARFYPVSWREDDQVSNVKMVSQAMKVLKMLFDYRTDPATICGEYRDRIITEYGADSVK